MVNFLNEGKSGKRTYEGSYTDFSSFSSIV